MFSLKIVRNIKIKYHTSKVGGFTLIELLVVIAIIGLLAAIVLVNMGDARDQGRDSAIRSSLIEVAKTAESFAGDNGTYVGVCDNDGTLSSNGNLGLVKNVITNQGGVTTCQESIDGFAIISTMNNLDCWCVDYQAVSKEIIITAPDTCASVLTGITCT